MYLGTPALAVPPLEALHDAGFDIALVVTGADKRRGRGGGSSATPVKLAALACGLPVSHDLAEATDVDADLGVVVAYGRILGRPLLEALPFVNLHFSLLPRWRGAAPVQRAILAGDQRTGVCVMAVEEGLDSGPIYSCAEVAVRRASTAPELGAQLAGLGARLLVDTLQGGLDEPVPQVGAPTHAAKITPEDLHLDWSCPAVELERVVRVGGAWTTFRHGRLKVHQARAHSDEPPVNPDVDEQEAGPPSRRSLDRRVGELRDDVVVTGSGVLALGEVQPEGKARVTFGDWVNGARPAPGERLGTEDGSEGP